jgi:hypothetical protein
MTKRRNQTIYRGRFRWLRLNAFGINNKIDWTGDIELYQARVSPELWRARPNFRHGSHVWEASSAELLMAIIEGDFNEEIKPFRKWIVDMGDPRFPSLHPAAPEDKAQSA